MRRLVGMERAWRVRRDSEVEFTDYWTSVVRRSLPSAL